MNPVRHDRSLPTLLLVAAALGSCFMSSAFALESSSWQSSNAVSASVQSSPLLAANIPQDTREDAGRRAAQVLSMTMTMDAGPRAAAALAPSTMPTPAAPAHAGTSAVSLATLDARIGSRASSSGGPTSTAAQAATSSNRATAEVRQTDADELTASIRARMQTLSAPPHTAETSRERSAAPAAKPAVRASVARTPTPPTAHTESSTRGAAWVIQASDKTLNGALARWASAAGWQLVWELPVDYAVETRTVLPGSFEDAVGAVAKSMEGAEVPMKAVFYRGNKVLRVMAKSS
ncbi:MAG: toxin co-regulated pilus biosynthesis Q family protein [Janthinobacterium lividum]